jgi:hypothetical protein
MENLWTPECPPASRRFPGYGGASNAFPGSKAGGLCRAVGNGREGASALPSETAREAHAYEARGLRSLAYL